MSPAVELRAAARTLRTLAKAATSGPWEDVSDADDGAWPRLVVNPGNHAEVLVVHEEIADYGVVTRPDTAWIARMHPGVAGPLAAWLESVAVRHTFTEESSGRWCGEDAERWPCDDVAAALVVARVINGTEEETAS